MRLFLYSVLVVVGLLTASSFHPRVLSYLQQAKHEVAENQRQLELVHVDQRLRMLKSKLVLLLADNPSFARVRVALIHSAIEPDGSVALHWSVAAALAAPGKEPGEFVQDKPLSQWNDYLGLLLNGHCSYVVTRDLLNEQVQARMSQMNISSFLACPIINAKHRLLGAVFVSWDSLEDVPLNIVQPEQAVRAMAASVAYNLANFE